MSSYLDWDDPELQEYIALAKRADAYDYSEMSGSLRDYVEEYYQDHFCEHTFSAENLPHPLGPDYYCGEFGPAWHANLELDTARAIGLTIDPERQAS